MRQIPSGRRLARLHCLYRCMQPAYVLVAYLEGRIEGGGGNREAEHHTGLD